jgi:diaminopimelate epimerase
MILDVEFVKYHGCGNDFIIVDELGGEVVPEVFKGAFSMKVCRRRFSVGADDVLFIVPSSCGAHGFMRVLEPDGTEAEMCGNGLRCVAAYLSERLGLDKLLIETRAGLKFVEKVGDGWFKADMGVLKCRFGDLKRYVKLDFNDEDELIARRIDFPLIGNVEVSIVDTGVPHVVIFLDDVDKANINLYAEVISKNKQIFPEGICVNLVEVLSGHSIKVRTYESGVWDETYACGTGSTASAAIAHRLGLVKSGIVDVHVRGGMLKIVIGDRLQMMGPAEKVFIGRIRVEV